MTPPTTEYQEWVNSLFVYNEDYEKVNLKIKDDTKFAKRLLRQKQSSVGIADALVDISVHLQRLVDLNAEAGYNYRGIKNFYERALITKKFEIMGSEEKKIAANVAEGQAVLDCAEEFFLVNEAERYKDTCEKRYEATKQLVVSLQTKLAYGFKP